MVAQRAMAEPDEPAALRMGQVKDVTRKAIMPGEDVGEAKQDRVDERLPGTGHRDLTVMIARKMACQAPNGALVLGAQL